MGSDEVVLNGVATPLDGVDPHTNALDWIRAHGLTGAKEGCGEGECGACAVLVARPGTSTPTAWVALNSCLMPAATLAGAEVLTVEGLGTPGNLHPVQDALVRHGGSQCGYCTPGFVCAMTAEYYRPERADSGFDLDALGGNLCRCTGYRPIRDAALDLGPPAPDDPLAGRLTAPPPVPGGVHVTTDSAQLVRPADLAGALSLLAEHPDAVVVAGSTDWGVEVNQRHARARLLVAIDQLAELRELHVDTDRVTIGAAVPLTEIGQRLAGRVPMLDAMLARFASRPVRNAATMGGNLATASPIGDCAPALIALGADLALVGPEGSRIVAVDAFCTGYRRTALRPGELIAAVRIPVPTAAIAEFTKVTKRWTDDISSVAVATALDLEDGRVASVRIGLGGVAATPIRARATEAALTGRPWSRDTVAAAAQVLGNEGTPLDDHRASADYRRAMLGQSLLQLHARSSSRADREDAP